MCDKDEYLLSLIRYIHQNPVRAKMVRRLADYPYSAHHDYEGAVTEIVEPRQVLEMLGGPRGYRRFVQEGLEEGHRESTDSKTGSDQHKALI